MFVQTETLSAPPSLCPETHAERRLPLVPGNIQEQARNLGWAGVGIMVALIIPPNEILLLEGKESAKFAAGTLGPLGETTKQTEAKSGHFIVEQPLDTLARGIQEEFDFADPASLHLRMRQAKAWCINAWPRGDAYPGELYCAISFPVFIDNTTAETLTSTIMPNNEEVMSAKRMQINDVMNDNPERYRQGTQAWLGQLVSSQQLCVPTAELTTVTFGRHNFYGSDDVLTT